MLESAKVTFPRASLLSSVICSYPILSFASHSYRMKVCLGKHNLKKVENTEQCLDIAEVKVHPEYDRKKNDKDHMLLRLKPCAKISDAVQTVQLPSGCPNDGKRCTVSGWGTTRSPAGIESSS